MRLVLLSGKAEHGKTASAEILKKILTEEYDKKVLIMGFADKLKFIAKQYFDWNGKKDEAGRQLLQWLGTDIVRARCPDYWVKSVYDFLTVFGRDFDYVLMHDTRFPNEISYFFDNDIQPFTVRILRLDYDNSLTPQQRLHLSETALDNYPFDLIVASESGLNNLKSIWDWMIMDGLFPVETE